MPKTLDERWSLGINTKMVMYLIYIQKFIYGLSSLTPWQLKYVDMFRISYPEPDPCKHCGGPHFFWCSDVIPNEEKYFLGWDDTWLDSMM